MINNISDCTVLYNGVKMPWLGLGVWRVSQNDIERTVKTAIKAGYRSIDTAAFYGNESGVGKAVKESAVPREDLFITTKVWNSDQGYDSTLKAFDESMKKLQLDYLDLYLIHWPTKGKHKDTWRALETLYAGQRVRAIGVCNFHIHHLEELLAGCSIKPMVNQVEFHPLLTQNELRSFCKANNIQFEAWSPLMQGHLDHSVLAEIGHKYKKSAAQVVLRWDLQNEVVTIPKSIHENRINENIDIFNFELTDEEMQKIDNINENRRFGPDPDNFDF